MGPNIDLSQLKANIFAEIVRRIGISWDEMYGRLSAYNEREGHCRVPQRLVEGTLRLGQWVTVQRTNIDTMSAERKKRLDGINFIWHVHGPERDEKFAALSKYKAREGHCRVPLRHVEGTVKLGQWVSEQRKQRDTMPAKRRQRLDEIGLVWDAPEHQWEEGFAALNKFKAREGHCRVPARYVEGTYGLGIWVAQQRENSGSTANTILKNEG